MEQSPPAKEVASAKAPLYTARGVLTPAQWAAKYRAELIADIGKLTRKEWCDRWGVPYGSVYAIIDPLGITATGFKPVPTGSAAHTKRAPVPKQPTTPTTPAPATKPATPPAPPEPPPAPQKAVVASAPPEPPKAMPPVQTPKAAAPLERPRLLFKPRLDLLLGREKALEDYARALEGFYLEWRDLPWDMHDPQDLEYDRRMRSLTQAQGVIEYLAAVLGRKLEGVL